MPKPEYSMYFTRVAPLAKDKLILSGHMYAYEDQRVTCLSIFEQGSWDTLADLPEIVASLISVDESDGVVCYAMLRNGVLHRWAEEQHSVEIIDNTRGLFFSEIRRIGKRFYACGAGHQVFRREAKGWTPIDEGIFVGVPNRLQTNINVVYRILTSIDGNSEQDIYAVGVGGVIFHYDGANWTGLESPTNIGLNKVRCFNGKTYICGHHGTFLRGDIEGWEVLAGRKGDYHLGDMKYCFDNIYVASEFELSIFDEESLVPVEIPIKGKKLGFGSLSYRDGQLWSVGGETILRFDGKNWTLFECPWNHPIEG